MNNDINTLDISNTEASIKISIRDVEQESNQNSNYIKKTPLSNTEVVSDVESNRDSNESGDMTPDSYELRYEYPVKYKKISSHFANALEYSLFTLSLICFTTS